MILVFGRDGQVGRELTAHPGVVSLGRAQADLSKPEACVAAIEAHAPEAVINAAAYTAVDRAEDELALATIINADAPTAMAEACKARDIPFVHISTDYVFDGSGDTPWNPKDPTDPQGAYGLSKRRGEEGVMAAGGRYAILRTSWVFSAHGANFVKTMLRLSEDRDALNIVADQIGGPTPARDIATACLTIARDLLRMPSHAGLYHYSGAPDVSWYDFATRIFDMAGRDIAVTPIPTSAFPTPAKRPLNSRLDCADTAAIFGVARPDWEAGLHDALHDLEILT